MESTKIVNIDNKYIKKELIESISIDMCYCKKNYIDFLIDKDIPAAKIIDYEIENNNIYEIQEYIPTQDINYNLSDYMKLISLFHNASRQYTGTYIQKDILYDDLMINNINLNYVLLGFREKYYIYPRTYFIQLPKNDIRDKILLSHYKIYNEFINQNKVSSCIIHNDLTSNNIIKGEKLTLIDFDFAIMSTPYVDITDLLFPRTFEIEDYLEYIKDKNYIKDAVHIYNQYTNQEYIDIKCIKLMAALKLYTYIMYIYGRNHKIDLKLYEYLMEIEIEVCDEYEV